DSLVLHSSEFRRAPCGCRHHIIDVHGFALHQQIQGAAADWETTAHEFIKCRWHPPGRDSAETVAVVAHQRTSVCTTEAVRLLQDRVEHWREFARRGINDAQYLGGRGLLFEGLARLGDEPRILHCDDRLRREIFEECDFLVAEWPNLLPVDDKNP